MVGRMKWAVICLSLLLISINLQAKNIDLGNSKYIKFQMSIDNDLEKLIRKDFNLLEKLEISNLSRRSKEIFGIFNYLNDEKSKLEFKNWVFQRIHFFIKDTSSDRLINKIKIEDENVFYPNNLDWPSLDYLAIDFNFKGDSDLMNASSTYSDNEEKLMTNISAPIYYSGKIQKTLFKIKIRTGIFSVNNVYINSPRTGIIQLGSALDENKYLIEPNRPDAEINSILRLSILFHEGRHSDGRGKTLGFLHVRCPEGHTYEGQFACDFNTNGPYTVGAETAKILLKSCKSCTVAQKEKMNFLILDSLNRQVGKDKYSSESICYDVVTPNNAKCDWDAQPEILIK